MNKKLLLTTLSLIALFIAKANAETINIAVASNFSKPIQEIAKQFEQQTGTKVIVSTGATGVLFNQIKNGAPYSLLLAADETTPLNLVAEGYAIKDSQFTYAIGQLVLWSTDPNIVDAQGKVLSNGKFNHLAMANPKLAPYGLAARAVITTLNLTKKLQNKIIQGENINVTYQYVASGNAELGFVALSQIYHDGKITSGSAWIVPTNLYPAIKEDAVLTRVGATNKSAQQFMSFLKSKNSKQIISTYGYK